MRFRGKANPSGDLYHRTALCHCLCAFKRRACLSLLMSDKLPLSDMMATAGLRQWNPYPAALGGFPGRFGARRTSPQRRARRPDSCRSGHGQREADLDFVHIFAYSVKLLSGGHHAQLFRASGARSRFAEVVDRALAGEPQRVTRHGKETVVVVSETEC